MAFVSFTLFVLFPGSAFSEPLPLSEQHVIALYSNVYGLPAHRKNASAFLDVLGAGGVPATNVHFEFLGLVRNASPAYRKQLPELLAEKYRGLSVTALVTVDGPAQGFILSEARDFFPGTPLISVLAPKELRNGVPERSVVQILPAPDFSGSLDLVGPVFPKRKKILCVIGASEDEKNLVAAAQEAFSTHSSRPDFEITNTLTHAQMLARVAAAGDDFLVFFVSFFQDGAGSFFVPRAVAAKVAEASTAPVLTTYDTIIDTGVLGGSLFGYETEGERAGKLVLALMRGQRPFQGSLTTLKGIHRNMLSWKQLERWKVEDHPFPEGTIFVGRPPSPWKQFEKQIIAAIALFCVQGLTILALLVVNNRRKRTERKLKESETSLRTLLEHAPDAICVVDVEKDRFVELNARAEMLFERTREQLLGMSLRDVLRPQPPDSRPFEETYREQIERTLAGGSPRFESQICMGDEGARCCEVQLVRLPAESGMLVRASVLDVSARKEAEEARSLFLASLSHEIRTPLNAIIGFSEVLLVLPSVPAKEKDYIKGIQTSALHLLKIISDLLEFARSEAEEIRLDVGRFHWNEMLVEVRRMISPLVREGIELHFTCDHLDLWVMGDRLRVLQSLLNVLGNAAKFTEKGAIQLHSSTCETEDGHASIEVVVRDTGIGIKEGYLKKLYTPFSQQDASLTRRFGGSGLGLAITRRFMTSMGGRIELESVEGQGTKVSLHFVFPLAGSECSSS